MKIKSYYATTVAEAIEKARRELGPEAMILASRKTGPEAAYLGPYEVVFGTDSAATHKQNPDSETEALRPSRVDWSKAAGAGSDRKVPPPEPVQSEADTGIARLKKHVESLRATMRRKPELQHERVKPQESPLQQLVREGFGYDIAEELASAVKVRLGISKRDLAPQDVDEALTRELESRLQVAPQLGRPRAERKIVALVGPPGAGKTTTLVKLAVNHGLIARRSLRIISADAYRLGASNQLRSYAAAMGLSIDVVENVSTLPQTLEEYSSKQLILLDTPGYSPSDMGSASQLASVLSTHAEVDVHLVLPAYMSAQNMQRTADAYRMFLPSKLIFTKLDEAASLGTVVSEALRQERPLSFVGTGQQVPEDLQEASIQLLLGGYRSGTKRNISAA